MTTFGNCYLLAIINSYYKIILNHGSNHLYLGQLANVGWGAITVIFRELPGMVHKRMDHTAHEQLILFTDDIEW